MVCFLTIQLHLILTSIECYDYILLMINNYSFRYRFPSLLCGANPRYDSECSVCVRVFSFLFFSFTLDRNWKR